MKEYTTVRIDMESMKKLEEIASHLEASLNINISKASALKYVINGEYESMVVASQKLVENMLEKEGKGE